MWITRVSINNPVFATMVMVGIAVLGLFAYNRLRVEQMPDVSLPYVLVMTSYPGANPEVVETDVTKPLEYAINTVAGANQCGRALLQIVELGGQDRRVGRQRRLQFDAARVVIAATDQHCLLGQLAALDRPDVRLAGFGADRCGRQSRHRRPGRQRDAARGEHAAAQRLRLVRNADEHQDGARAGLGGWIDPLDAAGELAVGEAIDGQVDGHPGLQFRNVRRRHRGLQLHVLQIDDRHQRRIEGDLFARLHVPLGDDARQRRNGH